MRKRQGKKILAAGWWRHPRWWRVWIGAVRRGERPFLSHITVERMAGAARQLGEAMEAFGEAFQRANPEYVPAIRMAEFGAVLSELLAENYGHMLDCRCGRCPASQDAATGDDHADP